MPQDGLRPESSSDDVVKFSIAPFFAFNEVLTPSCEYVYALETQQTDY